MPHIFISYRHDDSNYFSGKIYKGLKGRYCESEIFRDKDRKEPGTIIKEKVTEALEQSDVVLVIIGPQWLTLEDSSGNTRLFKSDDLVRYEVRTALEKNLCRCIPVLVGGASNIDRGKLPFDLRSLADLEFAVIGNHVDCDQDVREFVNHLSHEFPSQCMWRRKLLILISILAVLILVSAIIMAGARGSDSQETPTPSITLTSEPKSVTVTPLISTRIRLNGSTLRKGETISQKVYCAGAFAVYETQEEPGLAVGDIVDTASVEVLALARASDEEGWVYVELEDAPELIQVDGGEINPTDTCRFWVRDDAVEVVTGAIGVLQEIRCGSDCK